MNIEKKYNRDDFQVFLKSFVPGFTKDVRSVGTSGLRVTKEIFYLGESSELDLSIFELTHSSSTDARVALAMDGFKVMKDSATYRALVIYRSEKGEDWRLSLMTATPGVNEKGKVSQSFSNPRRFSFFLGPNAKVNTPYQFLIKQGVVKDFAELQKRFSLEVVNKEFYSQIALLFTQLAGGKRTIGRKLIDAGKGLLNLPSTVDDTLDKEFTVRLIGRLVFCWFLKKKRSDKNIPLLPEELLSAKAVSENKSYYHGILEPLFFEVLNTSVNNREEKHQSIPWSQIPFLNGGLFTPHQHDFYELGSLGISKYINTLKVPDHWIKELFEIFETYNFTIDENTSIDIELSIEPEMLGRIFENLLAEINPETGDTARKATGSYYTPRPIVEYMVDESLKQYLLTKTKLDENKIKSLLTYEDFTINLTDSEKESILVALDAVKVIDPACGSGAFPMGVLQKMLLVLQKIDPESEWWLERKLSQIESKLLKKELGKKLKSENVNYIHKLGIIQNSIYGVDIQPIAVEISKLRFFLSLIVDEKVDDAKENRGIEPLPNLEFKFVCANSLIGLPKKEKNSDELIETEDIESIKDLKDLRDEYLRSYGNEKEKIQIRFLKTQKKMLDFYWQRVLKPQADLSGNQKKVKKQDAPEFTRMLSNWDPFSDEPAGWFDPEWMFGIRDGFNIVIANPPYVFTRKMDFADDFKRYVQENYFNQLKGDASGRAKQSGKINLFCLFIMKGINLSKEAGLTTYIVPNTILRTTTYDIVRKHILDSTNLKQIVDLGGGVFDSVTAATVILIMSKDSQPKNNIVNIVYEIEDISSRKYANNHAEQDLFLQNTSFTFNIYVDKKTLEVLQRVKSTTHCLGELCIDIIEGIVAHKHLITEANEKGSFSLVEGKDIKRYFIQKLTQRIIWNVDQIHRTRPDYLWKADRKIIIQRISGGNAPLVAALDVNKYRTFASVNNLILKGEYRTYYNYILALLNSKLINFYYANNFSNQSKLTVNISKTFLESIPVVIGENELIDDISKKVDIIIADLNTVEKHDKSSSRLIQQTSEIDQLVYDLYGLTKRESETVENFYKDQNKEK